jgi:3-hydroxyisobutyrate dehydrogenase
MIQKIAFVGVGRMGANMARRLKDCGQNVVAVLDHNPAAAAALAAEIGCEATSSLQRITETADVIFTVVTDDAAQLAVFAETGDSLLVGAAGKIFINCATIHPKTHLEVERRAHLFGADSLEACMASSIPQARNGTLYLMCGGTPATFAAVKPLLEHLSSALRYIGVTGQAAQVKALVNMVMNINTAGLAEGLGLGNALGLDLSMLREVFAQTGANSQVLKTDGEDMQNRDHSCFFSAAHAAKDSGIAYDLGRSAGLTLPLAKATKEQYERMVSLDLGGLDKSGIAELTFRGRHA